MIATLTPPAAASSAAENPRPRSTGSFNVSK
jgi:hypothetical protein